MNLGNEDRDAIGDAARAALADLDLTEDATSDQDASDDGTTDVDGLLANMGDADTSEDAGEGGDELPSDDGDGATDTDAGQKPGYDKMLEAIRDQYGDAGAEAFRELQGRTTRAEQRASEVEGLRDEVQDMLEQIEQRTAAQDGDGDERAEGFQDKVNQISDPDQREFIQELLDAYVEEMGFVKRDELDDERRNDDATRLSTEANRTAVELFGERFGTLDNGTFRPNPEYVERARPTLERLTEQGALTHPDLFKLSFFDDLISEAREDGRRQALSDRNADTNSRVRQARKATVASRNSGGTSQVPLYDPSDPKQVGDITGAVNRIRERLAQI